MTKEKQYYLFKMDGFFLNITAFLLVIIIFLITICFIKDLEFSSQIVSISTILLIPYFILHELLHSLSYVLHGANFKNIIYGAYIEKGIFYCLCKQNITKKNVLISLLYPFVFMGIVPYVIGFLFKNEILLFLSIANIGGCSGDLAMFLGLSRLNDFEYSEYDDPVSFGLYSQKDLSKKKLFGLTYIGKIKKLQRENFKKVSISKISIIFIIALFLLGVIEIFL